MMRFGDTFSRKTTLLLIGVGILIGGYALFEARRYLSGPTIVITSPEDGAHIETPLLEVRGVIKNASFITLNGGQIFTDESGAFFEQLTPPLGYTVLVITARDRFNKEVTVVRHITVTYAKEENGRSSSGEGERPIEDRGNTSSD